MTKKSDIDLQAQISELKGIVVTGFQGVHARQDITNGRIGKLELRVDKLESSNDTQLGERNGISLAWKVFITIGTIATGTPITWTNTTYNTNTTAAPHNPTLTLYTDPTGAAWTTTTIGTMEIGAKLTTQHSQAVKIDGIDAYVDYTSNAAPVLPIDNPTDWLGGLCWLDGTTYFR